MSLVRNYPTIWSPARELLRAQRELDNIIDAFFGGTAADTGSWTWSPPLEVAEDEDKITVRLELPGVKKDDVEVSLSDNTLTIRGEKKREEETKDENIVRIERVYGSFQRSISLPAAVDADKVEAKLNDGVLEVVLPKHEEVKPRKIKVQK